MRRPLIGTVPTQFAGLRGQRVPNGLRRCREIGSVSRIEHNRAARSRTSTKNQITAIQDLLVSHRTDGRGIADAGGRQAPRRSARPRCFTSRSHGRVGWRRGRRGEYCISARFGGQKEHGSPSWHSQIAILDAGGVVATGAGQSQRHRPSLVRASLSHARPTHHDQGSSWPQGSPQRSTMRLTCRPAHGGRVIAPSYGGRAVLIWARDPTQRQAA